MPETVLIMLNGYPQSGKDTFVNLCRKVARGDVRVGHISTVDKVKAAMYSLGWDGQKTNEARDAMAQLKQISNSLFDGPFNYVKSCMAEIRREWESHYTTLLFVDCREPEELKRFTDELGAKTMLIDVDRPEGLPNNPADNDVEKFKYDFIIDNHGTLGDLELKAFQFVNLYR